jgi:phosphomannomutase
MPSELIISVSGLRGVVGESLTADVATRYVAAFAAELPPGPVVIGRDGRASGPMFAGAISVALTAAGRDVLDAGVAATPTIGVLVRERRAAGGVQISASHNPAPYNGLKLFSAEGASASSPATSSPIMCR